MLGEKVYCKSCTHYKKGNCLHYKNVSHVTKDGVTVLLYPASVMNEKGNCYYYNELEYDNEIKR